MPTRKLYYEDSFLREFNARVLTCVPVEDRWRIELDATAFFPEEGGQTADTGTLGPALVTDVQEKDGYIFHYTDRPLTKGELVRGSLHWEDRWRKMQNHSGEHIFSGVVHRLYGAENCGFHLGRDGMTFDYNIELSAEQLRRAEDEANAAIWSNAPVCTHFPSSEELSSLSYRSKLDLKENVRLVEIEGIDLCACCAPHVKHTGEVGLLKILSSMRHRGGIRLRAVCGIDALRDYRSRCDNESELSAMLSTPQENLPAGVRKLLNSQSVLKEELSDLKLSSLRHMAEILPPTDGNRCLFVDTDSDGLRELVNTGRHACGGAFAAFCGTDTDGYRFALGAQNDDARQWLERMKNDLATRGGGSAELVMGNCRSSRDSIENFFASSF